MRILHLWFSLLIFVFGLHGEGWCCKPIKKIAFTFDDAPMPAPKGHFYSQKARITRIIQTLKKHSIPQVIFYAVGLHLRRPYEVRALQLYDEAGHLIGNHSYHHWKASKKSVDEFMTDVDRCHELIKDLKNFTPSFRFPYLDTGGKNYEELYARLNERGYDIGHVTVPTLDWLFNLHLIRMNRQCKVVNTSLLVDLYVKHIVDCANFFYNTTSSFAKEPLRQVVLLHDNDINALALPQMIKALRDDGWEFVEAKEALDLPFCRSRNSSEKFHKFWNRYYINGPIDVVDVKKVKAELENKLPLGDVK